MIVHTSLDREPVMCMLIIQEKDPNPSADTGINVIIDPGGTPKDIDLFFNNNGGRK